MIKVLHVVHSLNDGGIERLLLEICRKIDKAKFEVQICCLVEVGNLAPEFEKLNIKLHFLNTKREFGFGNIFINIRKILELRRIIKTEEINITHGHEFYPTIFSRISAILAGVKYRYITLHNMYYWWGFWVHLAQYMLSYVTTRVICNSNSTMKFSISKDRINKKKYIVIYNGIDCIDFSSKAVDKVSLLKDLDLPARDIVFVSIGNISPRKGYQTSIKAIKSLKKDYESIIYLIVGGKHHQETDEYDRLIKMISEENLKDTVFITGRSNDVKSFLDICDVYLMPSVVEGFGISLIEALAMEKAAVVSDIEPFKEIIDDRENGFFFETGNSESLECKIREVLRLDSYHLKEVQEKGRRKILKNFDSVHMVKEYADLYLSNYN